MGEFNENSIMEKAIKRRLARAKERAILDLKRIGYKIIPSDNSSFCILATRKNEVRFIRVIVDEITEDDIKLTKDYELPSGCVKEIWCKKLNQKDFEIKEVF